MGAVNETLPTSIDALFWQVHDEQSLACGSTASGNFEISSNISLGEAAIRIGG
jgi:hypothetical protein